MAKGVVIAAPSSGSGKTMVTLGITRALTRRGFKVAAGKAGPDYIDPGFHTAAAGRPCVNLDLWAMGQDGVRALAGGAAAGCDILVVEGVMGLFDGPEGASGSTADLAAALSLPVVLVVDASHQGQSIAALVHGFRAFRNDIHLSGVILNRVASTRHEAMLRAALAASDIPVIGTLRRIDSSSLPSRHLGLVQAQENQQLEDVIESFAAEVSRETFLDMFLAAGRDIANQTVLSAPGLEPLGQTTAIARDEAFSFIYEHPLRAWRDRGATLQFFSPLSDEAPPAADAVFLPGGYPELHAGKLAANARFLDGLRRHGGLIYGECGGYMVLGEGLTDAAGDRHHMAGLLPVTTSFAKRKLHLGYRQLEPVNAPWVGPLRGHEFHYSTIEDHGSGVPLFHAKDAAGRDLGPMGHRVGRVMGSYAHVIA